METCSFFVATQHPTIQIVVVAELTLISVFSIHSSCGSSLHVCAVCLWPFSLLIVLCTKPCNSYFRTNRSEVRGDDSHFPHTSHTSVYVGFICASIVFVIFLLACCGLLLAVGFGSLWHGWKPPSSSAPSFVWAARLSCHLLCHISGVKELLHLPLKLGDKLNCTDKTGEK